jgi:hypothetical protein
MIELNDDGTLASASVGCVVALGRGCVVDDVVFGGFGGRGDVQVLDTVEEQDAVGIYDNEKGRVWWYLDKAHLLRNSHY